jgi:hypothetical protein
MDRPSNYEIRVEGHLADRWSDWFNGLAIRKEANGETQLSGALSDQAALFGVLNKIHALNLALISVNRLNSDGSTGPAAGSFEG